MNIAVMLSTQPKWCSLIASGEKTVEVRKTKPKIKTPFKCYIYCSKDKDKIFWQSRLYRYIDDHSHNLFDKPLNGKVIGEFVCDKIDAYDDDTIHSFSNEDYCRWNDFDLSKSCMHPEDFENYAKEKWIYGWHISNLEIYDKPKELSEFIVPSPIGCCNEGKCIGCKWLNMGNGFIEDDCFAPFNTDEYKPLRRPPQSWCYVEELK